MGRSKLTQEEAVKKYSTEQLKMVGSFITCATPVEYQCKCGNIKLLVPSDIKFGQIKSCGCLHHIRHNESTVIDKYSTPYMKMIGKFITSTTKTKYQCICGNICYKKPINISTDKTKSCGCLALQKLKNRKIPKPGNSLEEQYPEIAKFWDYNKNYPVTPKIEDILIKELNLTRI